MHWDIWGSESVLKIARALWPLFPSASWEYLQICLLRWFWFYLWQWNRLRTTWNTGEDSEGQHNSSVQWEGRLVGKVL